MGRDSRKDDVMNKQLTQQDFDEQDITSGFVMNLIKLTQQNIRLAKQPINNERENYERDGSNRKICS